MLLSPFLQIKITSKFRSFPKGECFHIVRYIHMLQAAEACAYCRSKIKVDLWRTRAVRFSMRFESSSVVSVESRVSKPLHAPYD